MEQKVDLLIIGAGPFGLAMSAYAWHLGIDHVIVGKPMDFWKANMPEGMYLRSGCDWHLDPLDIHTIEYFLQTQGLTSAEVESLSLKFYLNYAQWFQEQKRIEVLPGFVQTLDHIHDAENQFRATMDDSRAVVARSVVIALGFRHFRNMPPELLELLPTDRYSHTCDLVDFNDLKGNRCLIIGGRQSAFEWAALANEAGVRHVHMSYRHDSPSFAEADWSWIKPLVDAMVENPGWFRALSQEEKDTLNNRFWAVGRLHVEPWLEARVLKETVTRWPKTQVVACDELPSGELVITLDSSDVLTVDHIILATGYKVQIDHVPFLAQGNILNTLATRNGYPILDEHFQTNIPGLFITSMPATQDFGLFFAFTVSVRTSAKIIGHAIADELLGGAK